MDAIDNVGVPCYLREIDEEAEELNEDTDADGLREVLVCGVLITRLTFEYILERPQGF